MTFEKLPRYMGYQTLPSQKSSLQQETYKYTLSWLVTFIIRNVLEWITYQLQYSFDEKFSVLLQTLVYIYIYHNRIFQNNIWCFNNKQKLINCSQGFEVLFIDSVEKKEKMKRGMGWITFAYECITTCIRYLSLTW